MRFHQRPGTVKVGRIAAPEAMSPNDVARSNTVTPPVGNPARISLRAAAVPRDVGGVPREVDACCGQSLGEDIDALHADTGVRLARGTEIRFHTTS